MSVPSPDAIRQELGDRLAELGAFIKSQREVASMSVRRLADLAGVSNPYLSQIERGLRAPSDQVLASIAKSLQTSADALQDQAEALAPQRPAPSAVVTAIEHDPDLTARQRQALLEVYAALTEVTTARRRRGRTADDAGPGTEDGSGPGEG